MVEYRQEPVGLTRAIRLLLLAGLVGCGVIIPLETAQFVPATRTATDDGVITQYETQLRAVLGTAEADRLRHFAGLPNHWSGPVPEWIGPQVLAADTLSAMLDTNEIAPLPPASAGQRVYDGRWRLAESVVYLSADSLHWTAPFRFSGINALESRVLFALRDWRSTRISGICDGPVAATDAAGTRTVEAGSVVELNMAARESNRSWLSLPPGTDRCDLQVRFGSDPARDLRLEREETADPQLAALDARYDVCATPRLARMDGLERIFFTGRWLSQTCVMDPGQLRLLPEAIDGFNAKVEALLGVRLPESAFVDGDPTLPLDFSAAPQLDMIVLSYLDVKADFSGFLIARMLRYHAARGALIRILVTDMLQRDKDRDLIEGLAADFPNVQLQFYDWRAPPFAPADDRLAEVHRVHHVKLFATLSPQPGRSRAILGGRNIHDGFLFDHALDLSRFPWLQNYGQPSELNLNYFSTYHDFEVELRDSSAVRTLVAHLSTIWHRDAATTVYRPFSVSVAEPPDGAMALHGARHFISVPFLDGGALEQYWIDLIDSAQSRVEIVTPYLNPTPAIEAALNRALARGVPVMIVARIRLDGDLGGPWMTEMNMLFVERHAARMELWEYDPPDVVMHTKMLLIDQRLSIVTSTNLNRRSFLHDTENGLAILDPEVYQRLRAEVQHYIEQSRRLSPTDTDIRPIARFLFSFRFVRDML